MDWIKELDWIMILGMFTGLCLWDYIFDNRKENRHEKR